MIVKLPPGLYFLERSGSLKRFDEQELPAGLLDRFVVHLQPDKTNPTHELIEFERSAHPRIWIEVGREQCGRTQ